MTGGKKSAAGLLVIAGILAGMSIIFFRDNTVEQLWNALKHLNPLLLPMGLAVMTGSVGCEALCTKQILKSLGAQVPYRRCLGYSFAGFYASSVTPSASGGQPAQIYYMSKDGIPAGHGALNMMLIAACYQIAALIWAGGALLLVPGARAILHGGLGICLLYGAGVMILLTLGMGTVMFRRDLAKGFMSDVLRLFTKLRFLRDPRNMQEKLDRQMELYAEGAACIKRAPGLALRVLLLCLLQQGLLFSVPWMVYLGFGLQGHGWGEIVGIQALLTLAVCNLPLPGAVGAAEGVFVLSFESIFGSGIVAPAMLVSRGISFYAFLLVSLAVTLAVHLRTCREARERRMRRLSAEQSGGRRIEAVRWYLGGQAGQTTQR